MDVGIGRATHRLRSAAGNFINALKAPDILCAVLLFFLLTVDLTNLKIAHVDQQFGDMAQYAEVVENIASRGVPEDQIMPNILAFFEQNLPSMTAEKLATAPLQPPAVYEMNLLRYHSYLILYPIAIFAWFFPVSAVLLALYVLCYTATVLLVYLALRRANIPVPAACAFCLLVICHPAWSEGLRGQFYPDRIFMFAGLLFMLLTSSARNNRALMIAAGLLCLSIDERTAITSGLFLLAYTVLYWGKPHIDRLFKLGLASGLIAYGLIVVKFFLPSNIYNAGFLPTSIGSLMQKFQIPGFAHDALLFLIVNCSLWVLSWFEWRAALIALLLMIPNIIGNIGGAEKLGWTTHYHDEYLPALIWAALMGFIRAYHAFRARGQRVALFSIVAALICFLAFMSPYTGAFARTNIYNLFVFWYPRESIAWATPALRQASEWATDFPRVIPENSVVTTVERGMPFLYHHRTLRMFPMDIDHADYALLVRDPATGPDAYNGVFNFLGPEETVKSNAVIVDRMRKDGYDFAHPVYVAPNGFTVLRRK